MVVSLVNNSARPEVTSLTNSASFQSEGPDNTVSPSALKNAEFLTAKRTSRRTASALERFQVRPDYAYPNTLMDRDELRFEMNKPSAAFNDLRVPSSKGREIGLLKLEILQCIGIPSLDLLSETDAFCMASCGSYAFKTDVIKDNVNPMWLSKMRRACIFPLFHAYARLFVGVFDDDGKDERDDFVGRIVLDVARMRPNCTYDVTLPLRLSGDVYQPRPRGSIRIRFHISWYSERAMVLSYLPKRFPVFEPDDSVLVSCCDKKSFQNISLLVHGSSMQGHFSTKSIKALVKEINFTRIHVTRYTRKREMRNLMYWHNPFISGFVFLSWMHSVYENTVRYIPGNLITLLLLYLWKNYAQYAIDNPVQNGFLAPTWEEIFRALIWGYKGSRCIQPLEMEAIDSLNGNDTTQCLDTDISTKSLNGTPSILENIANDFRNCVKVRTHRRGFKIFRRTFTGVEAVNFLVDSGCAGSREQAVEIGRELSKSQRLFEPVTRDAFFTDDESLYYFVFHDKNEYSLKTHQPWGRPLFKILGFLNKNESFCHDQLEMPYSNGIDHPRFTVQESLVIRSRESKSKIKKKISSEEIKKKISPEEEGDKVAAELGLGDTYQSDEMDEAPRDLSVGVTSQSSQVFGSVELETVDPKDKNFIVKVLKKPPLQNIDIKKKGDKPITDVLAEARNKMHKHMLHLFNDRTYVIKAKNAISESPVERASKKLSARSGKKVSVSKRDNDKLLRTGVYSHSNKYIAMVGVIVQPIAEIALAWLFLFRAIFNLFTWRDPILSFWVSVFGPAVVLFLHVFPWRFVMAALGVALIGPQNLLIRLIREKKGISPPDFDTIVKKRKRKLKVETEEEPLFSNRTSQNKPIDYSDLDQSEMRHIAVPYSPLMYSNRFYDWPPEPRFARVYANPSDESISERGIGDESISGQSMGTCSATETINLVKHDKKKEHGGILWRRKQRKMCNPLKKAKSL